MAKYKEPDLQYAKSSYDLTDGWRAPSVGTLRNFQRSAALGIVATHHPALHQPAEQIPVEAIQSSDTRALIDRLLHVSEAELTAGRNLVGLAAPQVGVSRSLIIANLNTKLGQPVPGPLTVLINPVLTAREGNKTAQMPEGCFSCGPLVGAVERPIKTHISYYDKTGKRMETTFGRVGSVILGHETDHLEGRLFPDVSLAQGHKIAWVDAEDRLTGNSYAATVEAGKICPPDQWDAFKRGDFMLTAYELPTT